MGKFSDILLTVDYDRTLTGPDGRIPERNLEAIRYFMEEGGAFTINTGRSIPMSGEFRKKVPVNAPYLLYNGSAAQDPVTGELAFCHEIPLDPWETIRECMEMMPDLTIEVQGLDKHYRFAEDPSWDAFYEHNNVPHAAAQPGDSLKPFLKISILTGFGDVAVGKLFEADLEEKQRIDRAAALMQERFGDYCEIFRAGIRILDIHAKGVSKGRSARELQAQLERKILVCVGDAENDLTMLREADYAYAPADGVVADRFENVCNCGDGAVADVIYKKIPELL